MLNKVADLKFGGEEKSSPSSSEEKSSPSSSEASSDESIPSRQERLHMYINNLPDDAKADYGTPEDALSHDGPYSQDLLDYAGYLLDMIEYLGFHITDPSADAGFFPNIAPFHDPPENEAPPQYIDVLIDCSSHAIGVYNKIHGTEFDKVRLVKANSQACDGSMYYITFEATDGTKNITQTFQALVHVPYPVMKPTVEFVRMEPPFVPYPHTTTTLTKEFQLFQSLWSEALNN